MEDDINSALAGLIDKIGEVYKLYLISYHKVASGNLANTLSTSFEYNGNIITVYFNIEEYYKYVEEGTSPHYPPINAIMKWLSFKHLPKVPMRNGRIPNDKQQAYMIQRGIGKNGTRGSKVLEATLESSEVLNIIQLILDLFTLKFYNEFVLEYNKIFESK